MSVFCKECGASVPDSVRFCTECGKPVGDRGGQPPLADAPPEMSPAAPAAPPAQAGPAPKEAGASQQAPAAYPPPASVAPPAQPTPQASSAPQMGPSQGMQPQYGQPPQGGQQPYGSQPTAGEEPPPKGSPFRPVSTAGFFFMALLFSVPVIGWAACIYMAVAAKNRNRRSYARSLIVLFVVGAVGVAVLYFAFYWVLQAVIDAAAGVYGRIGRN